MDNRMGPTSEIRDPLLVNLQRTPKPNPIYAREVQAANAAPALPPKSALGVATVPGGFYHAR